MVLSKLDILPPELIVETCDYLDGCDLYYSFYGLNQRIDTILDQHCQRLQVNFTGISKLKFDLYCNRILSRFGQRVVSLTLGGDQSPTPSQLTLFLSRFRPLATVFTRLESFKLVDFSKSDVQALLPELPALVHLKHLSIGDHTRLMPFAVHAAELISEDVELPIFLRSLAFPYCVSNEWSPASTIKTSDVRQLHAHLIHMEAWPLLFRRFPHLQRLTAVLSGANQEESQVTDIFQSTIKLSILCHLNVNIMHNVLFEDFTRMLASLPCLRSLSLEALNPELQFFEARHWEKVLPLKLVSFRFDLTMTLPTKPDPLELLPPFKSEFWLSRQWFVQCRLRDSGRYFRLSTVKAPIITILYWPDDELLLDSTDTAVYVNVTHIELWWNLSKSTYAECPKVRSIQLYGAGNDVEYPIHPNVNQFLQCPSLKHIMINNNLSITLARFALVLAASSDNVCSLTCSVEWLYPMLEREQYESIRLLVQKRIRKLNLVDDTIMIAYADLSTFCRTFINLHELTMEIESATDLLFLLNNLQQLTIVNISLPNDALDEINDIIKWLRENTSLLDFNAYRQITEFDTVKVIIWIGSRLLSEPSNEQGDP